MKTTLVAFLSVLLWGASLPAAPVTVLVADTIPGITVHTRGLFGADLAIWNSQQRFDEALPALLDGGYNYFRFPDGSLSNEYHWNGSGHYDSAQVWVPSDTSWAPGFLGEAAWRGTTKNNWGFIRPSHITDGDTATLWWGNVYDSLDPPWFVLDLGAAYAVDSLNIVWGSHSPRQFELAYWTEPYAPYPGVHQALENHLAKVGEFPVRGRVCARKFKPVRSRYFAVRFRTGDLPREGVQVKEASLFQGALKVSALDSVKVFAVSTHNGDFARRDWTDIKWNFETFMAYLRNFPEGEPVICVSAGTGSVAEAVAWMRYAKKKGYKIKNWQIGNELDGEWEETGPWSARQYAARFLAYARAMKAEDSTISIHGPLYSSHKFSEKGSGLLDGKNWMPEFLRLVGEAEKKDGRRYLDAVDMHTYPYWVMNGLNGPDMANTMREVGPSLDSLGSWMSRYLQGRRVVHLSEFSTTCLLTDVTMHAVQATAIDDVLAQLIVRFGDRARMLPWDVFGGMNRGPDGTYGTLTMTVQKREGSWNLWGSLAPTAEHFGLYLAFRHWIQEGLSVFPVKNPDTTLGAYALGRGNTSRVLLLNRSPSEKEVRVTRASGASVPAEAILFSEAQYHWLGSDQTAFAYPDMGPSGTLLPAGNAATVKIPPLGMALVLFSPERRNTEKPKFLQASLVKDIVLPGDTLDLTLTVTQPGGMLTYGKITVKALGVSMKITPADGAWGGSVEALHVKIPVPAKAARGEGQLYVEVLGLGHKVGTLRVPFRIRGEYRTISVFQDYEDPSTVSWYPVVNGNNATSMEGQIQKSGSEGSFMRHDFLIEQPLELSWPNFSAAHYPVKAEAVRNTAGIVFDYATEHSDPAGYLELLIQSGQVKDYDDFMYHLRNTHGMWVRDTVLWSSLHQEGWGKVLPSLDPAQIHTFAFRGRHAGKGYIKLDNIYFPGESGTEVPMPRELRRLR